MLAAPAAALHSQYPPQGLGESSRHGKPAGVRIFSEGGRLPELVVDFFSHVACTAKISSSTAVAFRVQKSAFASHSFSARGRHEGILLGSTPQSERLNDAQLVQWQDGSTPKHLRREKIKSKTS